jgi:hypothetical protein
MKLPIATTTPIWGIHAGKTGDAASLFLSQNCVALGWHSMGDLSKLAPNCDAYKASVAQIYPDKKAGAIPNNAGQLFRQGVWLEGSYLRTCVEDELDGKFRVLLIVGDQGG